MSKSKAHYSEQSGVVIALGEISRAENYIEIENFEEALEAINANKLLKVVGGELVISESPSEKLRDIRMSRDSLLAQSDVLMLKLNDTDAISGVPDILARQRLATYRQALRDVTLQDPFAVNWPVLETNHE